MADRKLIQLLIDEDQDNFAVEAISLVKFPAIEENFIYMSRDNRYLSMAAVDEEQRTLIGPALIPDKHIPRFDESTDEEYDVYFSADTVKRASELFLEQNRTSEHTFEHASKIDGVHVVESWLVQDPDQDKSKAYGLSVPKGTWMVRVKVDNDEVWESVKSGEVKGFSIEGYFVDQVEKMSARVESATPNKEGLAKRLYSAIMGILKPHKFYAEVNLTSGTTMITEGDAMELGAVVQALDDEGKPIEMGDGQYTTEAGVDLRVAGGKIVEYDGEAIEEEVVEEDTTSAVDLRESLLPLYYQKLLDVRMKKNMSKQNFSAERELEKWWIFMEPYNYDYRGQGFYIYPYQYNSYSAFQDALQEMYDSYPPDAEEWENVDADGLFELTREQSGLDESTYKFLQEFAEWADDNNMGLVEGYRIVTEAIGSPDPGTNYMEYLKESYQGEYKNLQEYVMYLIDDVGLTDEQADRYFDYEKFGRDVASDIANQEYERVLDDGGSEQEAEAASDKVYDMRDEEVGEMVVFEIYGGINQLDKKTKDSYVDWDKLTRDFSYDYSEVKGHIFWNH